MIIKRSVRAIFFASVLLAITLVIGCAGGPMIRPHYSAAKEVLFPALNIQTSAEIGQSIVRKAQLIKTPAIRVNTLSMHRAEVMMINVELPIRPGILRLWATSEKGNYYQYDPKFSLGIFVPNDKSQFPTIFDSKANVYGKTPVSGFDFIEVEDWDQQSFKRELVYGGLSNNTITILYREFSDNAARPAFYQELRYDLNQGSIIGYRGARFEVLKATNTELVYKVLKTLD